MWNPVLFRHQRGPPDHGGRLAVLVLPHSNPAVINLQIFGPGSEIAPLSISKQALDFGLLVHVVYLAFFPKQGIESCPCLFSRSLVPAFPLAQDKLEVPTEIRAVLGVHPFRIEDRTLVVGSGIMKTAIAATVEIGRALIAAFFSAGMILFAIPLGSAFVTASHG